MQSLSEHEYECAEWHLCGIGIEHLVKVAGPFHPVAHALIREQVDTQLSRPHY